MSHLSLTGRGLAGSPDHPVQGELDRERLHVRLQTPLIDPMVWTLHENGYASGIERNDHTQRYLIHGRLDTGEEVTLHDAMREGQSGSEQSFRSLLGFSGVHINPGDAYTGVRVEYPHPWANLISGAGWTGTLEPAKVGTLEVRTGADGVQFTWKTPRTFYKVQQQIVDQVTSMLMILTRRDVRPAVQVLILPTGEQVQVLRPHVEQAEVLSLEVIAYPSELGSAGLETWLEVAAALNPLVMVTAKTILGGGDIEARVMRLAACAEALERLKDRKIMSKAEGRAIREAALARTPEHLQETVGRKLGQLRDPFFDDRLRVLVEQVGPLAESIAGPQREDPGQGRDRWAWLVKEWRNASAHMLSRTVDDPYDHAGDMLVLTESLGWLMTALLLLKCGFPAERLEGAITGPSAWHLYRSRAVAELPEVYSPFDISDVQ